MPCVGACLTRRAAQGPRGLALPAAQPAAVPAADQIRRLCGADHPPWAEGQLCQAGALSGWRWPSCARRWHPCAECACRTATACGQTGRRGSARCWAGVRLCACRPLTSSRGSCWQSVLRDRHASLRKPCALRGRDAGEEQSGTVCCACCAQPALASSNQLAGWDWFLSLAPDRLMADDTQARLTDFEAAVDPDDAAQVKVGPQTLSDRPLAAPGAHAQSLAAAQHDQGALQAAAAGPGRLGPALQLPGLE